MKRTREEQLQAITDVVAQRYNQGLTYTKAVVALGYGSIFAIWSFAKLFMPPWAHALAALLMLLSAATLSGWEVFGNLRSASYFADLSNRLNQELTKALESIKEHDIKAKNRDVRSAPLWRTVVWITLLTASGAALLIGFFACQTLIAAVRA